MTFKKHILLITIILIVLLGGCSKDNQKQDVLIYYDKSSQTDVYDFVNNFNNNNPDYELLDFVIATEENSPVKAVIIAFDKEKNSSATLFFLFDNDDWGIISFDRGKHVYYRPEDGLRLEKNVVLFSVDYEVYYSEYEIHDFELTLNRSNDTEPYGINYKSKETTRQKKDNSSFSN